MSHNTVPRTCAATGAVAASDGAVSACLALSACRVEQTREGEMLDVDGDVSAGNLPECEIEKTREGEMPDVDVSV